MGLYGVEESRKIEETYEGLRVLLRRYSKDKLIRFCAFLQTQLHRVENQKENATSQLIKSECLSRELLTSYSQHLSELPEQVKILRIETENSLLSKKARNAANKKHGKPGGSRDKQKNIRAIWATGKYTSRDICAEQCWRRKKCDHLYRLKSEQAIDCVGY